MQLRQEVLDAFEVLGVPPCGTDFGRRASPFVFTFSGGSSYSGIYSKSSEWSETDNVSRQQKEKEEYERRMRQFEEEIKNEEREKQKLQRQEQVAADQRASARSRVFEHARKGESSAAKSMIEEDEEFDVNAPERLPKQKKQRTPQSNFETLLHLAATRCNEDLVVFLLDKKGANLAALNQEGLTPFQASVLSGNVPVAQFFISRRAKSEGCHPSKAATDGRTPLQLAIGGDSIPMVELVLKHATVHDVQKCWERMPLSPGVKEVLKTKNGFVPIDDAGSGPTMSKKAQKQAVLLEEKNKRLAEERERAADNLRKKKERAERREKEEREKEETARKMLEKEQEEAYQAEVARQEALRRKEAEEHRRAEERRKAWEEQRRREEEERRCAEEEIRHRREQEALLLRQKEEEAARRVAEEAARRVAEEAVGRKAEDAQRMAESSHTIQVLQPREGPEGEHPPAGQQRQRIPYAVRKRLNEDPEAKRAEGLRRLQAQAEEHRRQREQREEVTVKPVQRAGPEISEEAMRRRAEQSARDKARYQRMREERAREKLREEADGAPSEHEAEGSTLNPSRYPLTPSSMSPSPLSWSKYTRGRNQSHAPPVVTPEDLQTCAIPDHLFAYEAPIAPGMVGGGPSDVHQGGHGGERSRGRGRRGRGRGRGRGIVSGAVAEEWV